MKILFAGILFFLIPLACFSQSKASFSVYFDFDSYALTPAAAQRIDSFLQRNKDDLQSIQFELYGHCDSRGSDPYNDSLSEKRVNAVRNYFLNHGLHTGKNILTAMGYGERSPVNENKTEEERQLNRRVEIVFLKTVAVTVPPKDTVLVEKKTGTLTQKISDSTTRVGTTITLRNINFVGGTHIFLRESEPMLNELLEAMRTHPQLIIQVEGHICCEPGPGDGYDNGTGFNTLSVARAWAVQDWLLKNGIEANRVSYKGFGHSSPIYPYPEKTEEERLANRRVEIKIIHK